MDNFGWGELAATEVGYKGCNTRLDKLARGYALAQLQR